MKNIKYKKLWKNTLPSKFIFFVASFDKQNLYNDKKSIFLKIAN